MRDTEFIVALNKVDRLYGWRKYPNAPILKSLKQQSKEVKNLFNRNLSEIKTAFMMQGINTELYYENMELKRAIRVRHQNREKLETFNIVPTSATSGEGLPDLLLLLVQWTQKTMVEKLIFSQKVHCTVLEFKVSEGQGTTIDVILANGILHVGDQIVVFGSQGPIVAKIRSLLTPHPMHELRVKGTYEQPKEVKAAQGIKIAAPGLEHAIAGTDLYVVGPGDDLEVVNDAVMSDMVVIMTQINKSSSEGVHIQASSLGSLEVLLEFLKSPAINISVSGVGIGAVHKNDVMKANVRLEKKKKKEYAAILAFDVTVAPEAQELAERQGVKIFTADVIYHLFDQFTAHVTDVREERKKQAADEAVFPCLLKILPNCIFNKKDPIILGVKVVEGTLKVGTPFCVPMRDFTEIGKIASIQKDQKPLDSAGKNQEVCVKIVGSSFEQQKVYGRHFDYKDELVSLISRRSIDALRTCVETTTRKSIESWLKHCR